MDELKKTKHVYDYEYENKETREEILAKAREYLKHDDKWVRILAQIALYHYND